MVCFSVRLNEQLKNIAAEFAEHYHDEWGLTKVSVRFVTLNCLVFVIV